MFGSRPGKRAGPFSRRHVKNFTASLRRPYGIAPYNCGVIKPNTMLQPNKIARTVYPDQPAKDFNEFMAHNAKTTTAAVVDDYKERFDALWAAFTVDVQRNTSHNV